MGANTVWSFEEANLFCGKEATDQSVSLHLKLSDVKLPAINEQYQEHRSMAGPVAFEINTILARLECTFTIVGVESQVYKMPYTWDENLMWFDMYGVIRDQLTGEIVKGHAQFHGKLGRVDPQAWRRGDLMHTACAIHGIRRYVLAFGDDQIYYWDFFTNTLIVGGVNRTADINQALHVPVAVGGITGTSAQFVTGI